MSIWSTMDLATKILMIAGLFCIGWGYWGIVGQKLSLTPNDFMSIGLGFIGIALAYTTMRS